MQLSEQQLADLRATTDRARRDGTEASRNREPRTAQPGDIFLFPVVAGADVWWVLTTHPEGTDRTAALVPADTNPMVGNRDYDFVAEPGGVYLVARCGFGLQIAADSLSRFTRAAWTSARAARRIHERLRSVPALRSQAFDEIEADPAYEDWCAETEKAKEALRAFLARSTVAESPTTNPSTLSTTDPRSPMSLSPWREIAVPRSDVLKGTFRQSEFAADLSAVRAGKAPPEYQDAAQFFERTYITEGMRLLLTQVAQRLSGNGGDPVIQLQTAFGGGKTHTMLAVWHLATRTCALSDLPGIPTLVEKAGLMDVPQAKVAVIDGTARAPGQPWKSGRTTIKTLWGELAWQLGGADGFALVKEADASATSPGKEKLAELLEAYAPCVILMDELVAYVRQFPDGETLSGGTYDSNLSFIQSLTEAAKLVPNAVLLASLPESDVEAGSSRGVAALRSLEKTFGRVQALWRPVGAEESFEIVRRRLFDPIKSAKLRDDVCRAFADAYVAEGAKLPSETQEGRYYDRLCQAYPIHPEVFDRLYEDWSTVDGFQRTRGVLKLMAKAISRLWKDNNADLMIMPGSLPLYAGDVRNEMTYLLPAGWEPVIETDIDGDRAETTDLENKEPRFGQVNAARRVARTLFLGTAPASVASKQVIRGKDRGRVLLGCLQPGQASALYSDALNRLTDRLFFLNSTGEKSDQTTRYWFDTRANLRREMEDRKRRFEEDTDVRTKLEEAVDGVFASAALFEAVHVFKAHDDVPDDSALRLVLLPPDRYYLKDSPRLAGDAVHEYLRAHGSQPRHRSNRLLFVAPDLPALNRLKDSARTALAWTSIVDDIDGGRLNVDLNQRKQAEKEAKAADAVLPKAVRECYRWLLCPVQDDPTAEKPTIEAHALTTSGGTVSAELERVCKENELVISAWSQKHLRDLLQQFYWKPNRPAFGALAFWEDTLRYLYLPRLKNQKTLAEVVRVGAANRDFFGIAYGQTADKYDGFEFGAGAVSFNDTLLLIEPGVAAAYALAQQKPAETGPSKPDTSGGPVVVSGTGVSGTGVSGTGGTGSGTTGPQPGGVAPQPKAKSFTGAVSIPAATAKVKLASIAADIIEQLAADPNATVRVTIEISADFPAGVSDALKRIVSENANSLGFHSKEWE